MKIGLSEVSPDRFRVFLDGADTGAVPIEGLPAALREIGKHATFFQSAILGWFYFVEEETEYPFWEGLARRLERAAPAPREAKGPKDPAPGAARARKGRAFEPGAEDR